MILFYIVWAVWFLSEILLNRLLRSGSDDTKNQDRRSLSTIWISIGVANTLGILSAIFIRMPLITNSFISYYGLGIIVLGMIIRFYAIASLGRFFTVDVTIRSGHTLKTDGIYKLVRHPSYLGSVISFAGFGISLNNAISLLVICVLVTYSMIVRINVEEKVLTEQFGEVYTSYMKKSYRLLPWIY